MIVHYYIINSVLYLYEFTLLSNGEVITKTVGAVLYLYEFTLLSNLYMYI